MSKIRENYSYFKKIVRPSSKTMRQYLRGYSLYKKLYKEAGALKNSVYHHYFNETKGRADFFRYVGERYQDYRRRWGTRNTSGTHRLLRRIKDIGKHWNKKLPRTKLLAKLERKKLETKHLKRLKKGEKSKKITFVPFSAAMDVWLFDCFGYTRSNVYAFNLFINVVNGDISVENAFSILMEMLEEKERDPSSEFGTNPVEADDVFDAIDEDEEDEEIEKETNFEPFDTERDYPYKHYQNYNTLVNRYAFLIFEAYKMGFNPFPIGKKYRK